MYTSGIAAILSGIAARCCPCCVAAKSRSEAPLRVNLRHQRSLQTSPLLPRLPPHQTRPHAAGRHGRARRAAADNLPGPTRPVDFRKGHDGLSALVQEMFGLDPFSGAVFVFRSKRADRVKILVWDRTGLVLVHKRLEGSKFVWPQLRDGVMRISPAMFAALFEGLDWRLVRPEGSRCPQLAG